MSKKTKKNKSNKKLKNCCKSTENNKKCITKDRKIFDLPRKFSKKKCLGNKIKGFSMIASCSPYKNCKKLKKVKV